jgi:hypoxanthine phosphoribosyltransferase
VQSVDREAEAAESASVRAASDAGDSQPVQPAIPQLWRHVRPIPNDPFAHQAERDFSSILSFYRVRWAYEPTSFPLDWGEDGRPCEMFTPDFYLPDQRLYVELTTMRQRLVTRKNRKLRRLRELYPDIRIKLLYRRDYHQLVNTYLKPAAGSDGYALGRIVYDEALIAERLDHIAAGIADDEARRLEDDPLLILVVSHGAGQFAQELRRRLSNLGVPCQWDRAHLTRSRLAATPSRVRLSSRPRSGVAGRRVLIVTDVVSTGMSGAYLCRWLMRQGARDAAICTLLNRAEARITPVSIRYLAFEAPNELLVGFGLQLRRQHAGLPHIAALIALPREE